MYRNMCVRMPDIIESTRMLAKIRLKTFQIRKVSSLNIWTILSKIGQKHTSNFVVQPEHIHKSDRTTPMCFSAFNEIVSIINTKIR